MRVLAHEHLCTVPAAGSSLRAEGLAMLRAVLADLAACPDVQVATLVEPSLVENLQSAAPGAEVHAIASGGVEPLFRRLAREADFALVIAPEFDDLLATRCEWALEEGARLLGPSPQAVRLCADKLRLARHLREHDIPTPETTRLDLDDPPRTYPLVAKLRTGAGAQALFVVKSDMDVFAAAARTREEGWDGDLIVQPYLQGLQTSVALLIGPRQGQPLVPAEQTLMIVPSPCGGARLRYVGGKVPLPDRTHGQRAGPLAEQAALAVPGLTGYVGVDLILGWDESGCDDAIIEINPRLTTSYVGLRRLARGNLMQSLLDVVKGLPVAAPAWHPGAVRFDADGTIH